MRLKLDARSVERLTLAADENEKFCWDTDLTGFGLRLRRRHDGDVLRTWACQYRASSKTRRHALGAVGKVSLTDAREAARRLLARSALGHDPQAERQSKRASAARTFGAVVNAYLAAATGRLRATSMRSGRLYLLGDYFAPLHGMPLDEITRADVAACLTSAAKRHSENAAAAARRWACAMFGWAIEEGWLEHNPVTGTRRPQRSAARERVLADRELRAIWNACADDEFSHIVRLLLLTGARRTEIGGICWSELDHTLTGDGGLPVPVSIWTLPSARSKNHRAHAITLPPAALAIIESVPRRACDNLFGSLWGKHRGFATYGRSKRDFDARLPDFVSAWRLHDLRRTVATGMINIGIEPHHVEAVLNHHSGHRAGVAGVYNRSPYERQIASALARWAEHVAALVEGRDSNVVAMRK